MKLLKLIHPELGLCVQAVVTGSKNQSAIKYEWRKKYGKMFAKCRIELFDDKK